MRRSSSRLGAALLAGCAALLGVSAASAQSSTQQGNWRQMGRGGRSADERAAHSPQSFAFELRFGPYYPQVDEEFGGDGPYEQVFGGDPQLYFGLEVDWLPLRIPYVGAFGPGVGWGYTRTSEAAKIEGTEEDSAQDTSLTIMPMHLSAVARFDELMRRTSIPIVPYVKLGIGFGMWSAGAGDDTARYEDGTLARDTTWGIHTAIGVMLALNWMDPRSSAQLDESVGVNHAYLFGEWMNADLDGIGSRPQMHIGSASWVLGLALDM